MTLPSLAPIDLSTPISLDFSTTAMNRVEAMLKAPTMMMKVGARNMTIF